MPAMPKNHLPSHCRQRGAVLLLLLLLVSVGALAVFVSGLNRATQQLERDRITAAALAQAKAGLIGYAISSGQSTGAARPGDLPCPDLNDDGSAENACGNASGTTGQALRIGRLPWRTLGLPDLRDGSGERLWYAVSTNYKNNTRSPKLNGETGLGTISVRDSGGAIISDGMNPNPQLPTGAIAVIIAPGNVLVRQGSVQPQNRNCTIGTDCTAQGICTSSPFSNTPKCNSLNYLDMGNGEDNADFVDKNANGFIQGEIRDMQGNVILNDKLITVSYAELMSLLERRVANEARQGLLGMGYFPWAASYGNPAVLPNEKFISQANKTEGLLPIYAYRWKFGGAPAPGYTFSGTVGISDLESGFVEPGTCTGFSDAIPSSVVCTGIRLILNGLVRRNVSISFDTTSPPAYNSLTPPQAFANGDMSGVLSITDTCVRISLPECPTIGASTGSGGVSGVSKITVNTYKSTSFPEWLSDNDWHRLMYYAVSSGFASPPLPTMACSPRAALPSLPVSPSCIRVNNTSGIVDNKQAVIIMTGRALATQNRSAGTLDTYLEGANATIDDFDFDANGNQVSTNFNDRLTVVNP